MTAASATLGGHRVTHVRVAMSAWGCPYIEATVDGDVELAGASDLAIADLKLSGTVLSGGACVPKTGRSYFRVVGGRGGWGRPIPFKPYANDAEVKLTTVINDAASACGEAFDMATVPLTERVGPAFVRATGPASRVLELVRPGNWYVGEDGKTRLGKRPRVEFTGVATRVSSDRAAGVIVLAATSIAQLVPGVVVDGVEAIDVEHDLSPDGGLRTTIWGAVDGGSSPRAQRLEALRKIDEHNDPLRKYRSLCEYRIVSATGSRVNIQPVRASTGLPSLERVPIRPGIAGVEADLLPGTRVVVAFLDSSPARPFVLSFEDADGEGFLPLTIHIDARTLVRLGEGLRPVILGGDLAGGIFPCAPTQFKVLGG